MTEYCVKCGSEVDYEMNYLGGCGDPECCGSGYDMVICPQCGEIEESNTMEAVIFLDEDGYVAYYKGLPNISGGGETKRKAVEELIIAYRLAINYGLSRPLDE